MLSLVRAAFAIATKFNTFSLLLNETAGNKYFRDVVANSLYDYIQAGNRLKKALIVLDIVESIKSLGGRFLKIDLQPGEWKELTAHEEKQRVGHAVRDALSTYENKKKKWYLKHNAERGLTNVQNPTRLCNFETSQDQIFLHSYQSFDSMKDRKAIQDIRRMITPEVFWQNDGALQSSISPKIFSADPSDVQKISIQMIGSTCDEQYRCLPQRENKISEYMFTRRLINNEEKPCIPQLASYIGIQRPQQKYSQAKNLTAIPQLRQLEVNCCTNFDWQFLSRIDDVLGPLPSDAQDPLEIFIKGGTSSLRHG
jgi:hypothetical protein